MGSSRLLTFSQEMSGRHQMHKSVSEACLAKLLYKSRFLQLLSVVPSALHLDRGA